jgi:hypothetical protein
VIVHTPIDLDPTGTVATVDAIDGPRNLDPGTRAPSHRCDADARIVGGTAAHCEVVAEVVADNFAGGGGASLGISWAVGADGRRVTKTAQIRLVGNSVCPDVAAALVRAQIGGGL